ncbi:hypothetical protein AOLI_G00313210, partial [Acnodon oligacanthus]
CRSRGKRKPPPPSPPSFLYERFTSKPFKAVAGVRRREARACLSLRQALGGKEKKEGRRAVGVSARPRLSASRLGAAAAGSVTRTVGKRRVLLRGPKKKLQPPPSVRPSVRPRSSLPRFRHHGSGERRVGQRLVEEASGRHQEDI